MLIVKPRASPYRSRRPYVPHAAPRNSYQAGESPKIAQLNQAAVEQLVQQEQARQAQMMFLSKLAEIAFKKCVVKPDTALSSREVRLVSFSLPAFFLLLCASKKRHYYYGLCSFASFVRGPPFSPFVILNCAYLFCRYLLVRHPRASAWQQ
jgi:hypothetical protein